MHKSLKDKKPETRYEKIFETEHRLQQEAKELAAKFKHIKPTKYLLKC